MQIAGRQVPETMFLCVCLIIEILDLASCGCYAH